MKTEMATKGKEEGRWKHGAFLPFHFMVLLNHCSCLRNLCLSYRKPQTQTWRQRTQWFPVQSGSHVARHCEEDSDVSERASLSSLSAVPDHQPGGRRRRFQLTEGNSGKNGRFIPFSTWCRTRTQNPVLSWVQQVCSQVLRPDQELCFRLLGPLCQPGPEKFSDRVSSQVRFPLMGMKLEADPTWEVELGLEVEGK